jgi:hypothetical protein
MGLRKARRPLETVERITAQAMKNITKFTELQRLDGDSLAEFIRPYMDYLDL